MGGISQNVATCNTESGNVDGHDHGLARFHYCMLANADGYGRFRIPSSTSYHVSRDVVKHLLKTPIVLNMLGAYKNCLNQCMVGPVNIQTSASEFSGKQIH
jgi:hypothetical protein